MNQHELEQHFYRILDHRAAQGITDKHIRFLNGALEIQGQKPPGRIVRHVLGYGLLRDAEDYYQGLFHLWRDKRKEKA